MQMTRYESEAGGTGIGIEELVKRYPLLYHMTAKKNLPSITRRGLLSTSAMLRHFQVPEQQRLELETRRRPESVEIRHPDGSVAEVRDHTSMKDEKLCKYLEDGLTPREWYQILNSKVFFWVTLDRLNRMSYAYSRTRHAVFVVDTDGLLAACLERVTLSPIYSGSTLYNTASRGLRTFLPPHEYPFLLRRRKRGPDDAVAELAVEHSLPEIWKHVLFVYLRGAGGPQETIWQRGSRVPGCAGHG